jgi:hypothetical protein
MRVKDVLPEVNPTDTACVAVMVMAVGVYAIIVATPSLIVIGEGEADVENVYAPSLVLLPSITDVSENETSVPYVFVTSAIG